MHSKRIPRRLAALLATLLATCLLAGGLTACAGEEEESSTEETLSAKPVIYLYPEETAQVTVKLTLDGELTTSYPPYGEEGWRVTADPDGTLLDAADGREYSYLFWEGTTAAQYDLSQGFVVPGADTRAFLQRVLPELGLLPREYNEFIVYWLPRMEGNPYNLISFQTHRYTQSAKLEITPRPDSLLRVFMAWRPLEEPAELPPQALPPFERKGFAVVEWGGAELP